MYRQLKHPETLKILGERAESKDGSYQQKALSMVECQVRRDTTGNNQADA